MASDVPARGVCEEPQHRVEGEPAGPVEVRPIEPRAEHEDNENDERGGLVEWGGVNRDAVSPGDRGRRAARVDDTPRQCCWGSVTTARQEAPQPPDGCAEEQAGHGRVGQAAETQPQQGSKERGCDCSAKQPSQ